MTRRDAAARNRAPTVKPSEQHAQLALRGAAVLMVPIVRWLLRHGVAYGAFTDLLKAVFVQVAREELSQGASKLTDSALSVLSGVHRKDVRAIGEAETLPTQPSSVPLASQVFTRWLTDAHWRDRAGKPRPLPRTGDRMSFETLARSLSNDVHPRTVLDELVRLGLVQIEGDTVLPRSGSFVPSQKQDALASLFAANVSDHTAAAVHNLTTPAPKFLEQSVFADGLTEESVDQLHQTARDLWAHAFDTMVRQATDRVAADDGAAQNFRIRFGVYYYSEPVRQPTLESEPAPVAKPPKRTRRTTP